LKEGKTMECEKCGKCCTNKTICLNDQDIEKISKRYSLPFFKIRTTGVKIMHWKQHQNEYLCVFLNPITKQCGIYEDRPQVCKEYKCIP
jgi:Fe-S-cluster containining protein